MIPLGRVCAGFSLLATVLLLDGCATYHYTQQKDSAYIRGFEPPFWQRLTTRLSVLLIAIDDGRVGMVESANSGRFLSPGKHSLLISCVDDISLQSDDEVIYPARARIEAEFAANHIYQFTIEEGLRVTLWDDTAGADKRVAVAHWDIDNSDIPTVEPIPSLEFWGDEFVSPPVSSPDHREHGPSHGHSGSPSIPNHPRPADGGGQGDRGHGSGGHEGRGHDGGSHAGGGGGHSGDGGGHGGGNGGHSGGDGGHTDDDHKK